MSKLLKNLKKIVTQKGRSKNPKKIEVNFFKNKCNNFKSFMQLKKTQNEIQSHEFEMFFVTFVVEHTVFQVEKQITLTYLQRLNK